jgi:carbamoyltransferase
MSKLILGISAFFHDSSAALILGDEILSAAQEERFTREKNTSKFPINSIRFCLESNGYRIEDIDAIVFYEKPFLKFERLIESHLSHSPRSFIQFITAIPSWLNSKLFINKTIRNNLKVIGDVKKIKILYSNHHLSHASSAYYCSSFADSAILTVDGVGEYSTTAFYEGYGNQITLLKEISYPNSIGLFYSSVTYFLGFKVDSGEYKVMGLAPYGNRNSKNFEYFLNTIKNHLFIKDEANEFVLNKNYFSFEYSLKMINIKKWEALFNLKSRQPESSIVQVYCDFALAAQTILEEYLIALVKQCRTLTSSINLCLAGGVALNCSALEKIEELKIFENIFVQPASGDAGGSLGSALAVQNLYFQPIQNSKIKNFNPYLGPEYSDSEISMFNKRLKLSPIIFQNKVELARTIAAHIAEGKIIGLFHGRMEFGPRALGNRSILADPRSSEMMQKLNFSIKNREGFRPFAPVLLEDDYSIFFNDVKQKPFMTFTKKIKPEYRRSEPAKELSFEEKITQDRSLIPAVTHVDFSSRIQTINKDQNELLYYILIEFKKITGLGILINTSFNQRGEPIVCSPEDAYNCFVNTKIDILVMGRFTYYDKNIKVNKNNFSLD